MKIFKSFEDAGNIPNPVVTTGSFDGVHIGHKTILNRLSALAEKYNGESVLITFHPHPRKVLYPDSAGKDLKLITSQEEKLYLLEKAGLENVIIIEFTREFSKTTSEQFVKNYLHDILHSKVVVAGFNHHFGFNKEGDYKQLWDWQKKYDFEAEEIPEQEVYHETVSSTKIRQAIGEGYIQRANAYLDHYYIIKGTTEDTEFQNMINLPSLMKLPVAEECKIIPALGIYAVTIDSESDRSKGMAIIHRSYDGSSEVLLDVFEYLNFESNAKVTVSFHKRISGLVDLSDQKIRWKINSAREEIAELIF